MAIVVSLYKKAFQVALDLKVRFIPDILLRLDPKQALDAAWSCLLPALKRPEHDATIDIVDICLAAELDNFFAENNALIELGEGKFEIRSEDDQLMLKSAAKILRVIKDIFDSLPYAFDSGRPVAKEVADDRDSPAFPKLRLHLWKRLVALNALCAGLDEALAMLADGGESYRWHIDSQTMQDVVREMVNKVPAESRSSIATAIGEHGSMTIPVKTMMLHAFLRRRVSDLSLEESLRELRLLDASVRTSRFEYLEKTLKDLLRVEDALKILLGVPKEKDLPSFGQLTQVPGLQDYEFTQWHYSIEYRGTGLVGINLKWSDVMRRMDESSRLAAGDKLRAWAEHWFKGHGSAAGIAFVSISLGLDRSILLGDKLLKT